jgi:NADPH:quinone reductase-like Zn-dependent oxidoreductase
MKAVQIKDYGTNDVVELIELEVPEPHMGEVLVRVQAAGVNPIDWKIRNGAGKRMGLTLPFMLGGEIVGTIEKVGETESRFKVGDIIYGMVKAGGFAEYVVAKASDITLKPKDLDINQAAAIPLGGLTAWQSIFDLGNLTRGQKILITGASGAVGSLAVQFAKAKGAYVIATASGKNEEFVKSLGVDEYINYEKQGFENIIKDVDIVFDTVGGDTFEKSFKVVKKSGSVVTSVAFPSGEEKQKFGVEAKRVLCKPNADQLNQISELVKAGKVKARVATVLPLERIKDALQISESGKANGKIVLQIRS